MRQLCRRFGGRTLRTSAGALVLGGLETRSARRAAFRIWSVLVSSFAVLAVLAAGAPASVLVKRRRRARQYRTSTPRRRAHFRPAA